METQLLYLTAAEAEGIIYIPDEVINEFIKLKWNTVNKCNSNETDEQLIILAYINTFGWVMHSPFYNHLFNKKGWSEFVNKVKSKKYIQ